MPSVRAWSRSDEAASLIKKSLDGELRGAGGRRAAERAAHRGRGGAGVLVEGFQVQDTTPSEPVVCGVLSALLPDADPEA
jgi:hypothetical protein